VPTPPANQRGDGGAFVGRAAPDQISRHQIRGSGLLLAGRGLSTAMKLVAELLVVRYLATEVYGSWTYALSAVVFLRGIATLGLNRAVVRFLPVHLERGERGEFFGIVVFVLGCLLSATGTAVTAFYLFPETVARLAGAGPEQHLDILFIVILLLPIDTLDDFLTGIFAAFSASWTMFVRRSLLAPGLRVVVALLLVLFHADVRLLAYGYLAAGVIGLVYYGKALAGELRRRGLLHATSFKELTLPVRRVLSYTMPVMAADMCAILLTTIGPLMLGYFTGMSAVALFQVVVPLVTLIQLVPQSFVVLYEPSAVRLHARGDLAGLDRLYWRSAVWVAVLSFPAFAASFTAAEPLSVLLFGERYRAAAPILSLLAFGAFFDAILGFNVPTLRAADKIRWLVGVNVLAAAASVVLHLLLIPSMGALGAGIATGASWTVYAGLKQGALWKATGVRPLDMRHAGPYLTMALVTVLLATVRIIRPSDAVVLVPTAILASLLVLARARLSLSITDTFPELGRFPLLKKVLG
jgi:O-antigen/teichoic acid export membrane protein